MRWSQKLSEGDAAVVDGDNTEKEYDEDNDDDGKNDDGSRTQGGDAAHAMKSSSGSMWSSVLLVGTQNSFFLFRCDGSKASRRE